MFKTTHTIVTALDHPDTEEDDDHSEHVFRPRTSSIKQCVISRRLRDVVAAKR
ncbi:hypothetical protein DPMN_104838 [Dreissena polymorpha]|uniref:Uncharacterized protein n=1 Tax=Dreissena polymorpha TaxID=45954 RepID=A0A9D4HCR1_DREPO|nr:hypothetical protein DPMN_104838 [Dreissena polymorpha]